MELVLASRVLEIHRLEILKLSPDVVALVDQRFHNQGTYHECV